MKQCLFIIKVSKNRNDFMKTSFGPKSNIIFVRISVDAFWSKRCLHIFFHFFFIDLQQCLLHETLRRLKPLVGQPREWLWLNCIFCLANLSQNQRGIARRKANSSNTALAIKLRQRRTAKPLGHTVLYWSLCGSFLCTCCW